jgi:pimeloyl-ACP methyl ester carboxylesterase
MPYADANGTKLYFEECGSGDAVIFVHEMAGDVQSWEPQMRYFSRRYRCIAFNARGYPPSDVPERADAYSQTQAADDVASVLGHLAIDRAHVVGLSMGSFATLHFGLRHREMARSLVVAACGHGSAREGASQFRADAERLAAEVEAKGMREVAEAYALNASRVQFQNKDPRGWGEWRDQFAGHSAAGGSMTLRNVQAKRPSLLDLQTELASLELPVLLVAGDEDDHALDITLWLKRTLPGAGLCLFPKTGHTVNLEEPARFNDLLQDFFWRVEGNAWDVRDSRSLAASSMFPED